MHVKRRGMMLRHLLPRQMSRKRFVTRVVITVIFILVLWKIKSKLMENFYVQRYVSGLMFELQGSYFLSQHESDGDLGSNGTCIVPVVEPFRKDVGKSDRDYKYTCTGRRKFYFKNGKYYISSKDLAEGKFYLQYIRRINDNNYDLSEPFPIEKLLKKRKGSSEYFFRPSEDFIYITGPEEHVEHHANVVSKIEVERHKAESREPASLNLKIVMIMIESQSAAGFQRHGRKILNTLERLEDTYFFKGHSIVGDGTTAQACAILTGIGESVLPESRKSFKNARPVDRWPFVFKPLDRKGYITMYLEDQAEYASFNYRLLGFTDPPTDHYPRPFFLSAVKRKTRNYCFGQVPSHQYSLDYLKSFINAYPYSPLFGFINIAHCCHDDFNSLKVIDADLASFVDFMKRKNYLNNTALFIFGDHGHRTTPFRSSTQGKLEERLPFLSITFPPWFKKKFPKFDEALKHNTDMLTSHFDLHATLQHLLQHPSPAPYQQTGQSLLTKIDFKTRSCRSAGIPDHYCPCLEYEEVDVRSRDIWKLAEHVVSKLNSFPQSNPVAKSSCKELTLKEVIRAGKRKVNWKVEKFVQTLANKDCDSCKLVFSKKTGDSWAARYEFVVKVAPSEGLYEASVSIRAGQVHVDPDISRLDHYGDQPKCIGKRYPHLRKFCYCNDYLKV